MFIPTCLTNFVLLTGECHIVYFKAQLLGCSYFDQPIPAIQSAICTKMDEAYGGRLGLQKSRELGKTVLELVVFDWYEQLLYDNVWKLVQKLCYVVSDDWSNIIECVHGGAAIHLGMELL